MTAAWLKKAVAANHFSVAVNHGICVQYLQYARAFKLHV